MFQFCIINDVCTFKIFTLEGNEPMQYHLHRLNIHVKKIVYIHLILNQVNIPFGSIYTNNTKSPKQRNRARELKSVKGEKEREKSIEMKSSPYSVY